MTIAYPSPRRLTRSRRSFRVTLAVVLGLVAFGMEDLHPPVAAAFAGNVLYTPNLSTYPNASANYAWTLRLQYSGTANGTVLAIHDDGIDLGTSGSGEPMGFPVYSSSDNGRTWSSLSRITDTVHGWQMFEPMLYELPSQIGSGSTALPAGTILAAGLALAPIPSGQTSPFGADLEVYKSTDHGATWSYLSSCATITNTQVFGAGIWEPDLQVDNAGNLVCYFSDERDSGSTGGPGNTGHYSQLLGHAVSTDGGQHWGSEVFDVAVNDGTQRPGMPDVIKLPNGTYFMAYEVCGQPDCQVRYRTSTDGDSWGTASNLGTVIQTSSGKILGHTPYVTWTSAGGANGTLIISAMHVDNSDGSPAPENGRALMVNTNLGSGNWSELAAPLALAYGSDCAGWRQALLPTPSGTAVLQVASTAIANNKCEIRYATGDSGTLPFYAPLDSGTDAGWTTYGGTWSVSGGSYTDSAGGAGDKAVAGSTAWTDYTVQADVKLSASADAGLLFRVSNPSTGTDALTGYYFGIDAPTGKIVLGRENNSWTRLDPGTIAIPGGVSLNTWYHLVVQATGCTLNVSAQVVGSTSPTTYSYTDSGCYTTGQIGVRTHNTAASWRNVVVTPGGTASYVPVYAPWASGSSPGWTTYGGTWSVASEAFHDSTVGTSGDKALTGQTAWTNSTLTGDIELTSGTGNGGLVARVTNPAVGADAYTGYYAGIDSATSQVVLGRANNSWTRLDPGTTTVPGGVSLSSWYHLTFQHVGCGLTVTAQATTSYDQGVITYTDTGCTITNGQVGIRDYNSAASWRYFNMLPR